MMALNKMTKVTVVSNQGVTRRAQSLNGRQAAAKYVDRALLLCRDPEKFQPVYEAPVIAHNGTHHECLALISEAELQGDDLAFRYFRIQNCTHSAVSDIAAPALDFLVAVFP